MKKKYERKLPVTLKTFIFKYEYIKGTLAISEMKLIYAYSKKEAQDLFMRYCNLFRPTITKTEFCMQTNAKYYTKECSEESYYEQNHYIYKLEKERGLYGSKIEGIIQNR